MKTKQAIIYAILAAALYAINVPMSKLLLNHAGATIMASFLYLGAGIGLLLYGTADIPERKWIFAILLLGFVAYGLSIKFYIMAQQYLGAAKTSAYYSIAPFLGVAFSMILLREKPSIQFFIALIILIASTILMVQDSISSENQKKE